MNTIENNKLIAEFMGLEFMEASLDGHDLEPQFHTSWSWLMPAVKKCTEVAHESKVQKIHEAWEHCFYDQETNFLTGNITNIYTAVKVFIQLYNESKDNEK